MFEDEDDEESFEDFKKRQDGVRELPIYLKGKEIADVVSEFLQLIPEDNEHLNSVKSMIMEDAYMLSVKIVNAEACDIYDLKMENAAIIRKAARDLMVQYHTLKDFGFEYVEYFNVVRELIEEYRLLFIDWVAAFDQSNYIVDRWGLFNPPGVSPFDE